nr:MAG TPA: hypothetical protein [Caudoviricetes sp.]
MTGCCSSKIVFGAGLPALKNLRTAKIKIKEAKKYG